jgi:hypothetical protein
MGEDQWRPGFVDYLFLAFKNRHSVFAHRCSGAFALGQNPYAAASGHIARDDVSGGAAASKRADKLRY